ncbi:ligase-associated DNA damage response exonuclease [Rhodoblastus acidophilus]|jgi:putative mRNA 3-end processing factor|uniref:Ligase-associated DNA damage response exonuclease n=1 Tax=Rhodoblastus acidophilus TaxID=1074 RepID=A0A6N8DKK2_RHOAC|nr:ligase-associated DNA damage response exonuclease [Rhodoblastus acidophilus]MCW2273148.1 putative mRNA 3-end processing factor [Rhodoblastus acidophilus]MTV30045.1 ligase-associated DNA damage response exonuclease [Rhodoblastus acidophilus]
MRPQDLAVLRPEGLFCPPGDFLIDPLRPAARAVITHGHSDHARPGHDEVICTEATAAIMQARLGERAAGRFSTLRYGEKVRIGEVDVTLVPAGHVLGSAQVLLEWRGLRIVFSGDYKRDADPTCAPFEPVRCHVFITEATFGLPVFRRPPPGDELEKLRLSMARAPERWHVVGAYALGKAQRLVAEIRAAGDDRAIAMHGAAIKICELYQNFGAKLGALEPASAESTKSSAPGLVICPPSALQDRWSQKFGDAVRGMASGWMQIKGRARQRNVELPLILSDHADWPALQQTILDTGAEEIWITHGQEDALMRWCDLRGLFARPLNLHGYEGEEAE